MRKRIRKIRKRLRCVYKMKCKICNEGNNYCKNIDDEKHNLVLENFAKCGNEGNCPICDGVVKTRSVGYEGWATECDSCNFLFDED